MKLIKLFTYLLFGIVILSCSDKDSPPPTLEVGNGAVNFNQEASMRSIEVKTNINNWTVSVPANASTWLSASKSEGRVNLTVKANEDSEQRSADVSITASNLKKIIKVTQMGSESTVLLEKSLINIDGKEQTFNQVITSDKAVEIEIPQDASWLTLKDNYTEDNGNQVFVFSAAVNTESSRSAIVKVGITGKPKNTSFTITQAVDAGYTAEGAEDVLGDIKINVLSGSTTSFQPNNGEIEKSFDGDYNTLYHSLWDNRANNYFPITLEYRLAEASQLDYFVYYPRNNSPNGNFKEVDIYVSTKDNRQMKLVKTIDFKASGSPRKVIFDTPIQNPYAVRFVVKSGGGHGQGFAAVAEMEFYQKNPKSYDPLQIFTDYSMSKLKNGITIDQINEIPNKLYKNIAYRLSRNEYPSEFRIQEYKAWPHPDSFRQETKSNTYSLLDNPTGIYVDEGDVLIVGVDDTKGNNISIKIQNLDKPGNDGYNQATFHSLSKGINKIENHGKGLIYVLYHTANYQSAPKIKIHFATGKVNGYYDSQKHTRDDWSRLLNAASYKYFDVVGAKAHLTFGTDEFRAHAASNGPDLIDQYDQLVIDEQDFMGFYKYNKGPKNRAYFHEMYHSYMYSTTYRTAYTQSTLSSILNYEKFKKQIWGPAHELGHTHQVSPGFKWVGMTEVSNNVLSEYIQTKWLGYENSRLNIEDMGGGSNRYEKGFNDMFAKKIVHGAHPDVFVKLIPFWQLQLIMAEVEGKPDFYKDLYEDLRNSPNVNSSGEEQLQFLVKASQAAQIDFTEFFKAWGLLSPIDMDIDDYGVRRLRITQQMIDNTEAAIAALGHPKANKVYKYITETSFPVIKSKQSIVQGSYNISGKNITLNNWQNVVAVEVYNASGELIHASARLSFDLESNVPSDVKIYAVAWNGTKVKVN